MSSSARQTKPARKGAPADPSRRPGAWSEARASPTFASGRNSPRPNGSTPAGQGGFPSLANASGARVADPAHDRVLQSIAGLTGTTITLVTKTGQHLEGVVFSTNGEGDTAGVALKDVKEVSNPGAPLKAHFFIASTNIETWDSGPADAKLTNGEAFRTDTEISKAALTRRDRELQAWQPNPDIPIPATTAPPPPSTQGDEITFGPGSNNGAWDQFAVNEKLFGVTTNFDEDVYTTKLDRSAADFKERERKAQKIANEIASATTNNPHIAEERVINIVDDSGINEEDKYGAVVRGSNAYIPPGARRQNTHSATSSVTVPKTEIPRVSINAPDGAPLPQPRGASPPLPSKAPSTTSNSNKPPADPLPAFRDFVTNEKQRLNQKRQALVKSEMDKRMANLVQFSQSFKLNKPIPDDLVPILAKDEEKQKQIREKANKDAASADARRIGASSTAVNAAPSATRLPSQQVAKVSPDLSRKTGPAPPTSSKTPSTATAAPAALPAATKNAALSTQPVKTPATAAKPAIAMYIQAIPPFKGSKSRPPVVTSKSNGDNISAANGSNKLPTSTSTPAGIPSTPASPTAVNINRLNVNASSFKPNPKASAFSPVQATPSSNPAVTSASPKPKNETTSAHNPFFGARPIKKSLPVNIKDDFNPFKHNKVVDASAASAMWPYSGKRYMHMFPPPQFPPPQHPPHVAPPGPPPMPPPSYEEDSAAQAAARGYVYAYPPYAYPGQPMMPGMPPPPPGAYMPGPFMQPMGYPPGMVQPNGQPMYSPGIGQMPPPQAYMPPPPPGTYPPPPNSAAPRQSMPPTPIPAHAHPYYHQSPQLQHAVPYPMMMPPPAPNVAPHVYEGGPAPPVQMGHT